MLGWTDLTCCRHERSIQVGRLGQGQRHISSRDGGWQHLRQCVVACDGALPDLRWAIGGDEARLAKAEALAAHPGTVGEGEAAQAAVDRLTAKLWR